MAYDTTPPVSKLSPPCGTRTLQALIISIVLLLASTAVVVSRAEYYRFELTHVDANLGLSIDELMRRAYDRTRLRAATLYNNNTTSASDVDSPILSPANLSKAAAEYFMKFYIGQRTDATSAVMDTGSNLIWTAESECSKSTTKSQLPCSSHMCKQHANCRCDKSGTRCEYDVKYGGNKDTQTVGVLYTDSLTFLEPHKATGFQRFDNIAIGCATGVAFKDPSINGIVGLGRGDQSLPGQLKSFSKFSYCLSSYTRPDLPSYLLFATAPDMATGARSGATVATTGLRRRNDDSRYKTWYFVDLQAISIIGGTHHLDITVPVPAAAGAAAGGGNMFVDSGASFTGLEENVFNKLVHILNQTLEMKAADDGRICNSSTTPPDASWLPQMVLHFADSANMSLPWDSYLWYVRKQSKLCLAIEKTTGMPVLGNYQMQGKHMLFDKENDKLSFVPADCSKV